MLWTCGHSGRPPASCWQADACRACAPAAVVVQAGASIKLDELLISGLYGKKERNPVGHEEAFEEVLQRLLKKLQLFHRVTRVTEKVGLCCLPSL